MLSAILISERSILFCWARVLSWLEVNFYSHSIQGSDSATLISEPRHHPLCHLPLPSQDRTAILSQIALTIKGHVYRILRVQLGLTTLPRNSPPFWKTLQKSEHWIRDTRTHAHHSNVHKSQDMGSAKVSLKTWIVSYNSYHCDKATQPTATGEENGAFQLVTHSSHSNTEGKSLGQEMQ